MFSCLKTSASPEGKFSMFVQKLQHLFLFAWHDFKNAKQHF